MQMLPRIIPQKIHQNHRPVQQSNQLAISMCQCWTLSIASGQCRWSLAWDRPAYSSCLHLVYVPVWYRGETLEWFLAWLMPKLIGLDSGCENGYFGYFFWLSFQYCLGNAICYFLNFSLKILFFFIIFAMDTILILLFRLWLVSQEFELCCGKIIYINKSQRPTVENCWFFHNDPIKTFLYFEHKPFRQLTRQPFFAVDLMYLFNCFLPKGLLYSGVKVI
jgi:hypothetical protein